MTIRSVSWEPWRGCCELLLVAFKRDIEFGALIFWEVLGYRLICIEMPQSSYMACKLTSTVLISFEFTLSFVRQEPITQQSYLMAIALPRFFKPPRAKAIHVVDMLKS